VGQDQPGARELAAEAHRVAAERGDPAAGVDEHGRAALVGERHQLLHRGRGEPELLRAGMELDAAGARRQRPLRLGHRAVVRVHAAVGHERPARGGGGLDDHVVGLAVPAGLVHREDRRAGVHRRQHVQELGRRLAEAVGVVGADVGVRVEELEAAGVRP
jgi:hypothetical protein